MKKLALILLCQIVCARQPANAHAVVTDYSLKMHPIQLNQASKVELKFNSKIELGLSQFFLVSKGDKQIKLEVAAGGQQGQMLLTLPALEGGDYALRLKVFAADGHLTEDIIHFSVIGNGTQSAPDLNRH